MLNTIVMKIYCCTCKSGSSSHTLLLLASLIILSFCQPVEAQPTNVYWVQFNSKASNLFLPPSAFLSTKSIERRTKQSIPIADNDYPVYQPYIQSVHAIADSVIHTLKWFNAITVVIYDTNKLSTIRSLPHVKTVQRIDIPVTASKNKEEKLKVELNVIASTNKTEYGIAENQTSMLRVNKMHDAGFKGKDVTIAVFDNGFINVNALNAYKHLFDEGRMLYSYNYVHRKEDVFSEGTHGAYVLSTMAANLPGKFIGTAPEANYLLFTTEDDDHETIMEELHWAEAAEKADSIGADIFNTSLGYITYENNFPSRSYGDLTGDKTIITQAANIAFSKGILVVNSAGNEGAKPWKYIGAPADGKDVLSIGAVDDKRILANFSSRGPNASGQLKPDICGQGSKVAVLDAGGNTALSAGTSFSSPIIAGSLACLWQAATNKSVAEIKSAIIKSAHLYNQPNNDYGYGIPNLFSAFITLNEQYNNLTSSKSNLIVFPNPLQSNTQLFLRTDKGGEVKIELADVTGKTLYKTTYSVQEFEVDLLPLEFTNLLSAGKYFLRVTTPSDKQVIRLIKTDE